LLQRWMKSSTVGAGAADIVDECNFNVRGNVARCKAPLLGALPG